jgi:hypothetical protein
MEPKNPKISKLRGKMEPSPDTSKPKPTVVKVKQEQRPLAADEPLRWIDSKTAMSKWGEIKIHTVGEGEDKGYEAMLYTLTDDGRVLKQGLDIDVVLIRDYNDALATIKHDVEDWCKDVAADEAGDVSK